MSITLNQANRMIAAIIKRGVELDCRPISVVVVEPGCIVKAFQKEDGASMIRFEMAFGKAYAALALSRSSKLVRIRNEEKPVFMRYLMTASGDKIFAEGGGMQIRDKNGEVIGAVGVTGDTEDRDEELAAHGIHAVGLKTDEDCKDMGRKFRHAADQRRGRALKAAGFASIVGGDFQDELAQHGLREIVVGIGRHDERARAADDVVEIIFVQVVFERHDRQAVDDDAGAHRLVARLADVAAAVVGAVARNVDDALEAAIGRARQQQHGVVDGAAERRAAAEQLPRRGLDGVGEGAAPSRRP